MKALQGSWPDHVRAWRRSGETGREYCAKRGLNVHTLWSWSARMQDEKRASSKASKPGTEVRMALVRPARTIEVTATPVGSVETGVRLRVGAVHVEVERGFDGQTLNRVLQVLEGRGAAR